MIYELNKKETPSLQIDKQYNVTTTPKQQVNEQIIYQSSDLKETIDLSNNILATIHLLPMPKKVNGEYPKITSEMPEISFTFWNKCESTGEQIKLKKLLG